jgi:hypothetical protein
MALVKFKIALLEKFKDFEIDHEDINEFLNQYMEEQQKSYQKSKENREISWGKYKNYTVKQLSLTDIGKQYLLWSLQQNWMTEDKFGWFIDDCKAVGIKKKAVKRAPLE